MFQRSCSRGSPARSTGTPWQMCSSVCPSQGVGCRLRGGGPGWPALGAADRGKLQYAEKDIGYRRANADEQILLPFGHGLDTPNGYTELLEMLIEDPEGVSVAVTIRNIGGGKGRRWSSCTPPVIPRRSIGPRASSLDSARSASAQARQAPFRSGYHVASSSIGMWRSRMDRGAGDLDPVCGPLRVGHPNVDRTGDRLTTAF